MISPNEKNDAAKNDRLDHLIGKYGGRAPRYTSYPTAAQFSPKVGAAHYRRSLAALGPADGHLSIYIHVPFCAQLCWYCGCHTTIVNAHAPVADYVADLVKEIDLVAAHLSKRFTIASIHFGGGTPNMLTSAELAQILARLAHRFDFVANVEIAIEIDPRRLTKSFARAAAQSGVTRASLGVQDFRPDVQAAIHRRQPYTLVAAALDTLHAAQIASIHFDLIYGLPRQNMAGFETTVAEALTLSPERLSLFGYAHVPWMKPHQRLIKDADLPDARLRLLLQRRAAALFESAGYARIGLDHFAKETEALAIAAKAGCLHRNFQGYTDDAAGVLLGFGASAISRLPNSYAQNAEDLRQWRAAIESGELPVARGVALSDDDCFRGDIIERLMCDFSVDLGAMAARHGRSLADLDNAMARLAEAADDGLVRRDGSKIEVTKEGRDFVRAIAAIFDRHLDRAALRHAQAV